MPLNRTSENKSQNSSPRSLAPTVAPARTRSSLLFRGSRVLFRQIGFRRPHHFRAQKAVSFRANRFPEAASFSGAEGRIISGKSVFGGRIISGALYSFSPLVHPEDTALRAQHMSVMVFFSFLFCVAPNVSFPLGGAPPMGTPCVFCPLRIFRSVSSLAYRNNL